MLMDGIVLGKYKVEKLIGRGAFSSVFRAKEVRCDRLVAIKALHKDIYEQGASKYIEKEIKALGRIWGHSNIVSVHTVEPGDDECESYIVMEYIDGLNLKELMNKGEIPLETTINIGIDICNGLAYAHEQNIIHRDIKPQNILLTQDSTAKVTDFGVARILEETEHARTLAGTRKYMAPEQYTRNYDQRVDIYATGLVLFEMLTGLFPFKGETDEEIKEQKQTEDLAIPNSVPKQLSAVLSRALQRDPNDRYETAADMYDELYTIRSDMFESYVVGIIKGSSDLEIVGNAIIEKSEKLKIPEAMAENIVRQVSERISKNRRERQIEEAKVQTMEHYSQTRKYLVENRPSLAFAELQQMVDINLDDGESKGLVRDIFTRIKVETPGIGVKGEVINRETLMEHIRRLPEAELKLLIASLTGEVEQNEPRKEEETKLREDPPLDTLMGITLKGKEYLQDAQRFYKEAQKYAKQNKGYEVRKFMRKSGTAYQRYAETLLKDNFMEEAALGYKKAAEAYRMSGKRKMERKYYAEAAMIYYKLAENHAQGRHWLQAGEHFQIAAETYTSAGRLDKSEESMRKAVASYYNIAKNLYSKGYLERALECCRTAIDAWNGRGVCGPVNDARLLLKTIESDISEGKMSFE